MLLVFAHCQGSCRGVESQTLGQGVLEAFTLHWIRMFVLGKGAVLCTRVASNCGQTTLKMTPETIPKVKACNICGHVGFNECLAVCTRCNKGAEHVYCMQTLVDTIPSDWICEECKVKERENKRLPTTRSLLSVTRRTNCQGPHGLSPQITCENKSASKERTTESSVDYGISKALDEAPHRSSGVRSSYTGCGHSSSRNGLSKDRLTACNENKSTSKERTAENSVDHGISKSLDEAPEQSSDLRSNNSGGSSRSGLSKDRVTAGSENKSTSKERTAESSVDHGISKPSGEAPNRSSDVRSNNSGGGLFSCRNGLLKDRPTAGSHHISPDSLSCKAKEKQVSFLLPSKPKHISRSSRGRAQLSALVEKLRPPRYGSAAVRKRMLENSGIFPNDVPSEGRSLEKHGIDDTGGVQSKKVKLAAYYASTKVPIGKFLSSNSSEQPSLLGRPPSMTTVPLPSDSCRLINGTYLPCGILEENAVRCLEKLGHDDTRGVQSKKAKLAAYCTSKKVPIRKFSSSNSSIQPSLLGSPLGMTTIASPSGTLRLRDGTDRLLEENAVPEVHMLWSGCFDVLSCTGSSNCYRSIQAYPSCMADPKVRLATKALPLHVQFHELKRGVEANTWPRSFQDSPPTSSSIGVFFFAADMESHDIWYMPLLHRLISYDLALRAKFNCVELLIFPSLHLGDGDRYWNGGPYLWGVFKANKSRTMQSADAGLPPSTAPVSVPSFDQECEHGMDNDQVVDMEIDMIGGCEVSVGSASGFPKGGILTTCTDSACPPLPPGSPPNQPSPPPTPQSQHDSLPSKVFLESGKLPLESDTSSASTELRRIDSAERGDISSSDHGIVPVDIERFSITALQDTFDPSAFNTAEESDTDVQTNSQSECKQELWATPSQSTHKNVPASRELQGKRVTDKHGCLSHEIFKQSCTNSKEACEGDGTGAETSPCREEVHEQLITCSQMCQGTARDHTLTDNPRLLNQIICEGDAKALLRTLDLNSSGPVFKNNLTEVCEDLTHSCTGDDETEHNAFKVRQGRSSSSGSTEVLKDPEGSSRGNDKLKDHADSGMEGENLVHREIHFGYNSKDIVDTQTDGDDESRENKVPLMKPCLELFPTGEFCVEEPYSSLALIDQLERPWCARLGESNADPQLALHIPQYRKDGNVWIRIEEGSRPSFDENAFQSLSLSCSLRLS